MGAPGCCVSTGGSNGCAAGMRWERDAMGSVTRGRLRSREGEPDKGMGGGTAFGGRLTVEGVGVGRGDVRASSKFSMGEAGGPEDDGTGESGGVEGLAWPHQRKTGCGDLSWGDCRELGGSAGMFSGVKLRFVGRELSLARRRRVLAPTLPEDSMSGSDS
jgi:hypothetical protein